MGEGPSSFYFTWNSLDLWIKKVDVLSWNSKQATKQKSVIWISNTWKAVCFKVGIPWCYSENKYSQKHWLLRYPLKCAPPVTADVQFSGYCNMKKTIWLLPRNQPSQSMPLSFVCFLLFTSGTSQVIGKTTDQNQFFPALIFNLMFYNTSRWFSPIAP